MILRVVGILHSWPTPFSVLLMVYWSGRAAKSGKAWEHMNDVGGCEVRGMTHSQFSMSWNSSSSSWLGLSDPLQVQTLDAIDNIHLTSRDEWSQTLFFATVPLPCYFFFNTNWRTENGIGGGHSINSCEQLKCGMYWSDHHLCMSTLEVASFPGRRRNGLATSTSSNCYFRCLKVGSTNQISEHNHMTTVKPNCTMHWTVAHSTSIAIVQLR